MSNCSTRVVPRQMQLELKVEFAWKIHQWKTFFLIHNYVIHENITNLKNSNDPNGLRLFHFTVFFMLKVFQYFEFTFL